MTLFSLIGYLGSPRQRSDVPTLEIGIGVPVGVAELLGELAAGDVGGLNQVGNRAGTAAAIHGAKSILV